MAVVKQAYRFCLDPTPSQERKLASHAGAARFAYNFGLALVKERLDRRVMGEDVRVPWSLAALRREWNAQKADVAPWWAENSKEAASSGLAALADGFKAFWDSKRGERAGRRVGFPRFKCRGHGRESFRYTTGRFGISGRCRVQLPRIGHVRTHEPTRKLQHRIEAGSARILSATICREGDRWLCSFTCEVERADPAPKRRDATVGVDVGVRQLAVLSSGVRVENPHALKRVQRKLRRLQRRADRQRRRANPDCYDERGRAIKGRRPLQRSNRQRRVELRIRRLHARVCNMRGDALHKLTTRLASTYGTIVCEQLNVRGLCRSGNRGLRRQLHDASLAEIGRQLTYKCAWRGGTLVKAPTFFPSSKTCSGCGAAKAKLSLSERMFRCDCCGLVVDRDLNAARNLAALVRVVAPSSRETENARSPTSIRPALGGRGVDREAGIASLANATGTAFEQSKAARD